jgi:hypothetical protein
MNTKEFQMSMLKEATNKMAYAKVGLYGTAGSGKTRTATEIAIGLHKAIGSTKPVVAFDTEPAMSFVLPLFQKAGIGLLIADESRALSDLMKFMDEAEKVSDIAIIDSITHVWRDAQESYLNRLNAKRKEIRKPPLMALEFQHWRPIKAAWAEFTDRFLSSKLHVIVCGRAGSVYEYQDNGNGKKELITVGTRMATEKELGYEPSLLVEMITDREAGRLVNVAVVQKDRSDSLNGQELRMPNYKSFESHFTALNIGGQHFDSMNQRNSQELFEDAEESGWDGEKRSRQILAEEIQGVLVDRWPGMTGAEKKAKADALNTIFGTLSWTKISEATPSEKMRAGLAELRILLKETGNQSNSTTSQLPEATTDISA